MEVARRIMRENRDVLRLLANRCASRSGSANGLSLPYTQSSWAEHGGPTGVRDEGLLDSALAKPRNLFLYEEEAAIFRLAASYAFGIIRNHPFVDGNKRTALVVSLTFLALNGWRISAAASKRERYLTFLQLAEGSLGEGELSAWFSRHAAAIR